MAEITNALRQFIFNRLNEYFADEAAKKDDGSFIFSGRDCFKEDWQCLFHTQKDDMALTIFRGPFICDIYAFLTKITDDNCYILLSAQKYGEETENSADYPGASSLLWPSHSFIVDFYDGFFKYGIFCGVWRAEDNAVSIVLERDGKQIKAQKYGDVFIFVDWESNASVGAFLSVNIADGSSVMPIVSYMPWSRSFFCDIMRRYHAGSCANMLILEGQRNTMLDSYLWFWPYDLLYNAKGNDFDTLFYATLEEAVPGDDSDWVMSLGAWYYGNNAEFFYDLLARVERQEIHPQIAVDFLSTEKPEFLDKQDRDAYFEILFALNALFYGQGYFLGFGFSSHVDVGDVINLIQQKMKELDIECFNAIATLIKYDDKNQMQLIEPLQRSFAVPLQQYDSDFLEYMTPFIANPSNSVFKKIGCHGVAESAALATAGKGAELVLEKTKIKGATIAIAYQKGAKK